MLALKLLVFDSFCGSSLGHLLSRARLLEGEHRELCAGLRIIPPFGLVSAMSRISTNPTNTKMANTTITQAPNGDFLREPPRYTASGNHGNYVTLIIYFFFQARSR